jgi:hypothetical protein
MKSAKQKAVHFEIESDENSENSEASSSSNLEGDNLVFNMRDIADEIKSY